MKLIPITESGQIAEPAPSSAEVREAIVEATTRLYRSVGYEPPWIGYFAIEDGVCVGTCGFKSAPRNNRVEIAYFTFPEYEARGVATRMANELVGMALEETPGIIVAAQTLPELNASTSILKKLGFQLVGTDQDDEVGLVWEWQRASNLPRAK